MFIGVHVIKRRSDWPESDWPKLFGMARTKDSAQRYSGFEVTCPDCDLKSALDHAARDKRASYFVIVRHFVLKIRHECSRNSNFE